MWQEYRINRRSAWSLPPDSDLLLNHLAALLQALPGMQEEITLYSPTRTSTACSPRASAASPT
jgi:hypothetical protein